MGLTETLTITFVVLKLAGVIDWSWWLVLLPEIIALIAYTLIPLFVYGGLMGFAKAIKRIDDL